MRDHPLAVQVMVATLLLLGFTGSGPARAAEPTAADLQARFDALVQKAASYQEAIPIGAQLADSYRASLGPSHPRTAVTLARLAYLHALVGDLESAERVYRPLLALPNAELEIGHLEVAVSLNNLAFRYEERMGDHERASALNRKALAIYEHLLPPEHPKVTRAVHRAADSYGNAGDNEASAALYERRLDALLGRQPEELESLLEASREMERSSSRALETADELDRIGDGFTQAGDQEGAIRAFEEVVRIRAQVALARRFDFRRLGIPDALRKLARAYGAAGRQELADAAEQAAALPEIYHPGGSNEFLAFDRAPDPRRLRALRAGATIRSLLAGPGVPDPDDLDHAPAPPRSPP